MHYSANEVTQVSVRGRVTTGGRPSAGNIQVLTTRQASTTYQRHSDSGPVTADAGVHVLPSITWSPLPPRRTTAAAAQSLCVTLYCDDALDDISDVAAKLTKSKAGVDGTVINSDVAVECCTDAAGGVVPANKDPAKDLAALDSKAFDVQGAAAAAGAVASAAVPHGVFSISDRLPLNTTRELSARGVNGPTNPTLQGLDPAGLDINIYPPLDPQITASQNTATLPPSPPLLQHPTVPQGSPPLLHSPQIHHQALQDVTQSPPLPHLSPEITHSPLHITHTPYSPPLAHHPPHLMSHHLPSATSSAFSPLSVERQSHSHNFQQQTKVTTHQHPQFTRYSTSPIPHDARNSRHGGNKDSRNKSSRHKSDVDIASMNSPTIGGMDASLTAHLPPWHSVGHVAESYKAVSEQSSNLIPDSNENNGVRRRKRSRAHGAHARTTHDTTESYAKNYSSHSLGASMNEVLDACNGPVGYVPTHESVSSVAGVRQSNYTAKEFAGRYSTNTCDRNANPVTTPTENKLAYQSHHSNSSSAHLAAHHSLADVAVAAAASKSLALPLPVSQHGAANKSKYPPPNPYKTIPATTTAAAATPLSPSDSILSTGFSISSSTSVQRPYTHPRDTPTHQPSPTFPPTRPRAPKNTSTYDLRLDSLHDLNWLNAMEPEDQVLLEVHVIWSVLTLMVVLLACYSLHHHPLSG